jgi:magnesium-transporting ATPase (P-type)
MGISGTEVAKESSDIIILDDDFTSIVKVAFSNSKHTVFASKHQSIMLILIKKRNISMSLCFQLSHAHTSMVCLCANIYF